ncbi:DoxX family protein [Candidatus Marinamargulisbacteria bacterium SCGC AG-439-L15]|nr:DoxX family protein [Candidatus Marinamargulisbacteria bacterium SCGC AG-439-L15]
MIEKVIPNVLYKLSPLISRILIAIIFIFAGYGKIMDPMSTQAYMNTMGMGATTFFLVCAIIIEIVGGVSILLGYYTRIGALLLIIFLLPTTIIFHTDFSSQVQVIMFLKNLAIMGGLFSLLANGSGAYSIDEKR